MVQIETLFSNRLIPHKLQRCLLKCIAIIKSQQQQTVTIYPNYHHGYFDSLFLFCARMVGSRRFLIKVFEMLVSGFIPPDPTTSLPSQLTSEVIDLALREHELDKREQLLHLRSLQIGVAGHKQGYVGQLAHLPSNQTSLQRDSVIKSATLGPRASWRWTIISETDGETDTADVKHPTIHSQPSLRGNFHAAMPQRTLLSDTSGGVEELKNMVINLQATVEALKVSVQQLCSQPSPHTNTFDEQASTLSNSAPEFCV